MFQPNVFPKASSNNRIFGKRGVKKLETFIKDIKKKNNLSALAEGEGGMATSLGRLGNSYYRGIYRKIIHRVPSVEGGTATSVGNPTVTTENTNKYLKKRSK